MIIKNIFSLALALFTVLALSGCATTTGRIADDGKVVATDTDLAPDGYPKSWGQPLSGGFDVGLNKVGLAQVQKVYSEEDAKKTELYAVLSASLSPEQLRGRGVIVRVSGLFDKEVSDNMVPSGGVFNRGFAFDAYVLNPAMRSTIALGDIVAPLGGARYGSSSGVETANPVGNMARVVQTIEKNTKGYGYVVRDMECVSYFLNTPTLANVECRSRIDTAAARKWAIESWKISPRK